MPATNWTEASGSGDTWAEASGSQDTWVEMITQPSGFSGYALFGMPIPIESGLVWDAPAADTFTQASVTSTSWTEAGT